VRYCMTVIAHRHEAARRKGKDMELKGKLIRTLFACSAGSAAAYFGALIPAAGVLAAVMCIDYITGVAAAWMSNNLSSKAGIKGIVKKVCSLCLVAVGIVLDYVITYAGEQLGTSLDPGFLFGLVVSAWLILNECISILENLGNVGVPLPNFLVKAVNRLRDTVEKETEDDN